MHNSRINKRIMLILAALLLMALCAACVKTSPTIVPGSTIPPTPTLTPALTPTEPPSTLSPTTTPMPFDAYGEFVGSAQHYERYLEFGSIQVYEQSEDTFMDAVVENSYPYTLICAVDIQFFDENETLIAEGKLQTRDGQYVLRLSPGETTLFARADSDVVLTDKEFMLVFDPTFPVMPDMGE